MTRGSKLFLGSVLILVAACALALTFMNRRGFSAKDQPTALEAYVARYIRHLAVPSEARDTKNPVAFSADVLAEAKAHFADHCASCHANDGSGTTEMGQNLYPDDRDFELSKKLR